MARKALSNLIPLNGDAKEPSYVSFISQRNGREYKLQVQQQPKQSRMCGSGDKADRRPIDPPPIISVSISHKNVPVPPTDAHLGLQSPYYFMFASLCTESGEELYLLANTKTRFVTGTTVSSLYHLSVPPSGDRVAYFVFPDIGVRVEGVYKFKMSMYEVVGDKVHFCNSIFTDKFYVYSAKRFPGMQPSTDITKSLSHQGIRLRVRKPIRLRRRGDGNATNKLTVLEDTPGEQENEEEANEEEEENEPIEEAETTQRAPRRRGRGSAAGAGKGKGKKPTVNSKRNREDDTATGMVPASDVRNEKRMRVGDAHFEMSSTRTALVSSSLDDKDTIPTIPEEGSGIQPPPPPPITHQDVGRNPGLDDRYSNGNGTAGRTYLENEYLPRLPPEFRYSGPYGSSVSNGFASSRQDGGPFDRSFRSTVSVSRRELDMPRRPPDSVYSQYERHPEANYVDPSLAASPQTTPTTRTQLPPIRAPDDQYASAPSRPSLPLESDSRHNYFNGPTSMQMPSSHAPYHPVPPFSGPRHSMPHRDMPTIPQSSLHPPPSWDQTSAYSWGGLAGGRRTPPPPAVIGYDRFTGREFVEPRGYGSFEANRRIDEFSPRGPMSVSSMHHSMEPDWELLRNSQGMPPPPPPSNYSARPPYPSQRQPPPSFYPAREEWHEPRREERWEESQFAPSHYGSGTAGPPRPDIPPSLGAPPSVSQRQDRRF